MVFCFLIEDIWLLHFIHNKRYNYVMKFLKKNLFSVFLLALFMLVFVAPVTSFAQAGSGTGEAPVPTPSLYERIKNPINVNSINGLVKTILEGIIKIGIPIVALAIIYSGFLFVTAQGRPEKIKEAKNAFLYTLVGAAILLGSWALAQLISDTVLAL